MKSLIIFAALGLISAQSGYKDIINESQNCGKHRFKREDCAGTYNCVFMLWYIDDLKNDISFCFSYTELLNFFIVNPK